jgi:hypothetical protein
MDVIPAKLVAAGFKQGAGIQRFLKDAGFRVKQGMTAKTTAKVVEENLVGKRNLLPFKG